MELTGIFGVVVVGSELMGELVYTALAPHPPIIIPEVGGKQGERCTRTQQAMAAIADKLVAAEPDTIIILTPHGHVFHDVVTAMGNGKLKGDLGKFGASRVALSTTADRELLDVLLQLAAKNGQPIMELNRAAARRYGLSLELDHGIMVPLYFMVRAGFQGRLLPMAMAMLSPRELYSFGRFLRQAIETIDRRVAVVASGDMSHRLTKDAPAGYHLDGRVFDQRIQEDIDTLNFEDIVNLPASLAEAAGECGWRTLIMLLGALEGLVVSAKVLSYEHPFGVGYLVAEFTPGEPASGREMLPSIEAHYHKQMVKLRREESEVVRLARETLECYVNTTTLQQKEFSSSPLLSGRAGVFVSIKKDGQLRGCIGTIFPAEENIGKEIMANTIKAGIKDPRFSPVDRRELPHLVYSVDILGKPESVTSEAELDPQRYGVIVRKGSRTGLLLPQLEGINTVEEQLEIASQKAGIGAHESYQIERFEVKRYH